MRTMHCVKSVCIRSFSSPFFPAFALDTERSEYSVRMRENTGQSNSEYGHFSRGDALREQWLYSEFFWSVFSSIWIDQNSRISSVSESEIQQSKYQCSIWTEYGEIRSISLYSAQMPENADQINFEYGHFSRSDRYPVTLCLIYLINQKGLSILFRSSHRRCSVRKSVLRNCKTQLYLSKKRL